MGSKAVAKRMGTNLLGDSSATDGIVKHHKDVVAADRLVWASSREEPFPGFLEVPVLSQGMQQNRGLHHDSIPVPFALMDGDRHARRVDIAHSQTGHLGAP